MAALTGWTRDETYGDLHETQVIEEGVVCACGWSEQVPDLTSADEAARRHLGQPVSGPVDAAQRGLQGAAYTEAGARVRRLGLAAL